MTGAETQVRCCLRTKPSSPATERTKRPIAITVLGSTCPLHPNELTDLCAKASPLRHLSQATRWPAGSAADTTRPFGCDRVPALNLMHVCRILASVRRNALASRREPPRPLWTARVNSLVVAQAPGVYRAEAASRSRPFRFLRGQINTTSEGQGPSPR